MRQRSRILPVVAFLAVVAQTACAAKVESAGGQGGSQVVSVTIDPGTVALAPRQAAQFTATVTGSADLSLVWSVDETGGGTVDDVGLYTAPAVAGDFHVRATSRADSSRSAVAGITVRVPPAGTVTISPHTATVLAGGAVAFTASVTGIANAAVTWSIQETGCGTVSAAGAYTAPSSARTCHVVATSVGDPTRSDVATVTVTPPVAVAISPRTASVQVGGTLAFTATVTGTANKAATWSVQEASGCGSVSAAGSYTAPGTAGTCHVVATSVADPTKRDVATVTVTPPISVAVTPSSGTVDACLTLTFSATVTGTTNQSVTWSVQEGGAGGIISAAGVYTAPPNAGTYHVVATSAVGSATGRATVTVRDHVLSVTVQPASVTLTPGGTQQFTATVTTSCGAFTSTQTAVVQ